ncbi:DedA family protein [Pelagicoccus mobilis]|uniref:VTT domain-containing protein n=1 Tax=Pelagicoccus mobilis TaxID=415221 RepID=A0A934RSY0_9BACT|nr:DedA family protein [Pelagicoccus mobilis]MBK1877000.1 VTT domain-containing protein [Pelagicoccus mobilis]
MKTKSKLIVVYGVLLLVSFLWQRGGDERRGESAGGPEFEGKRLLVLFERVVESEGDLSDLAWIEANFEVWRPERVDGKVDLRAIQASIERSGAEELWVAGSGYGSVDAVLLAEQLGREKTEGVLLVDPVVSTRFELLGDERLNTAMKAFQLAWFWVLDHAVPHFGYAEQLPYNLSTAKRIFEADQKEAEIAYRNLNTPIGLIFEGIEAAFLTERERAYLEVNPNASLLSYDGLRDQGEISFSPRSEGVGEAAFFADYEGIKLGSLWGGFLLAVSTLASEDFACIGGGLLASSGAIDLVPAILGCLLGIFWGDLGIYFIGRSFGATALELPVLRRMVSGGSLHKSKAWFEKRGVALVVLTRFFPGSRVPTYFAAGVVKVSWIRFSWALLVASAVWTPILVLASYYAGEAFLEFFESIGAGGWFGIVLVIVAFAIGARLFAKLVTWRGRRLLYSQWRRLVSWEFWPMWAVYLPVVPYIIWLSLRYRSISLPFSVNPCMPASGLVYESKIQILEHLSKHGVPVARFEAIELDLPLEDKLSRLDAFMNRLDLPFPVVLKPDIGQRGQGVTVIKSREQARSFFEGQNEDSIVQEFIGGSEYGVFYQRFESKKLGWISSITDKRTTSVVGDGQSTLEELILGDQRAVCMAKYFLSEYESQLDSVPQKGERFMLASIGTHSRGAVFLDGEELITPELEEAVDSFSSRVEGFHFGRYDLRVPSVEHLKRGEGIRVIELNGITSEPTNMYDPKHGPFFGWSSLMRQWKSIFELAKENRLAGHEPVSKRYVVKLAIAHFRGSPSRSLS